MVSIRWYLGFLKGQLGGAGGFWVSRHLPHALLQNPLSDIQESL